MDDHLFTQSENQPVSHFVVWELEEDYLIPTCFAPVDLRTLPRGMRISADEPKNVSELPVCERDQRAEVADIVRFSELGDEVQLAGLPLILILGSCALGALGEATDNGMGGDGVAQFIIGAVAGSFGAAALGISAFGVTLGFSVAAGFLCGGLVAWNFPSSPAPRPVRVRRREPEPAKPTEKSPPARELEPQPASTPPNSQDSNNDDGPRQPKPTYGPRKRMSHDEFIETYGN